ncbi:hypothetical protein CLU79DRAFT_777504 [Phycomyces nitens]|nr:hypothetical protein CLU79DRAFT_777504 [Phycomyces nitens]
MAVHLTESCEFAILVAIEDGRGFTSDLDRDLLIYSRIRLPLPPSIDDLLLADNLIAARPVPCTAEPSWRTTFVYFVSLKMLRRLRERSTPVVLELSYYSEDSTKIPIGNIQITMDTARLVVMRNGRREPAQVHDYVVDKGNWHTVGKERAQIKAGLFIVDIPSTSDVDHFKGMNNFRPSWTSRRPIAPNPLGFELCSVSDHLSMPSMSGSEDKPGLVQQIGHGTGHYTLECRILQARHLASVLQAKGQIRRLSFHFSFGGRRVVQTVEQSGYDNWPVKNHDTSWLLSGSLEDILVWLECTLKVYLVAEYKDGRTVSHARAKVYLGRRQERVVEQSFLIYDRLHPHEICISPSKQLAQIVVRSGLTQGWDESFHGSDDTLVHQITSFKK